VDGLVEVAGLDSVQAPDQILVGQDNVQVLGFVGLPRADLALVRHVEPPDGVFSGDLEQAEHGYHLAGSFSSAAAIPSWSASVPAAPGSIAWP
jgi:hypothetical protein